MEDPQIESEDPASVARRISLNALARRAYSTGELKRLLEKKLVPSEIIHELIVKLTRSGLLNDSEYARAFRDSRIRTKGLSARLIARELQERGIDSELIQEVVDEIAHLDFPDAAIVAAAKKIAFNSRLSQSEESGDFATSAQGILALTSGKNCGIG